LKRVPHFSRVLYVRSGDFLGRRERVGTLPLHRTAKSLKIQPGKFYICSYRNTPMYDNVLTYVYYVADTRGDSGFGMG
jgi:hypothetical protein